MIEFRQCSAQSGVRDKCKPLAAGFARIAVLSIVAVCACGNPPTVIGGPGDMGGAGRQGGAQGPGDTGGRGGSDPATGAGGVAVVLTSPDGSADRAPTSTCGDGTLDQSEQCDDGNTESSDGCSRICQIENNYECPHPGQPCDNMAKCGNGLLTSDEVCDDNNTRGGDGCSADCKSVEPGWQCRVPGKPCTPKCGDGVLADNEVCDDGNTAGGDGCSATCRLEPGYKCEGSPSKCSHTTCGDGNREGAEGCDDGNTMPFDGCSQECQGEPDCSGASCTSKCGDGIVLDEDCDDGNAASGDGCSSACKVEPGWTCKQPALGDKMLVPVIYRDFRSHVPSDFEPDVGGAPGAVPGMVENDLDKEGKPVYTGITGSGVTVESPTTFSSWYRTTPNVNHPTAGKLALWKTSKGGYVNRYGANGEQWKAGVDGNPLFFPVDGDSFTPASERAAAQVPEMYDPALPYDVDNNGNQKKHNFSFTSEVRYWFKFDSTGSYQLDFVGDDDVWVFINKKLAVDVGGLHSPATGSVTLNAATAATLGNLKSDRVYEVAVFHAERHTTASSYKLTLTGFNAALTSCVPTCGDGVAVADEECDNGKDNSDSAYGGCTTHCKWGGFCGDGMVNGSEECDSGKNNGTQYGADGCTLGCTRPHFCGDGHVDTDRGEECDLADKNGVTLDKNRAPSTDKTAQIFCTIGCKIPPGIVF
jgi:fibro-slime domain-containing protein